jgi:hypothetical protein
MKRYPRRAVRVSPKASGLPLVPRRAAPTALAATLAAVYLAVRPRSLDLAAALLRVRLFGAEGFGLWNNWWYGGHNVLGYSGLFPALGSWVGPRVVAAAGAIGAAAAFDALARRRSGDDALPAALWFAAGTVTELLSGRLAFALGLAGAVACALALARGRMASAWLAALFAALTSPVAALFAATAGAAYAIANPRRGAALLAGGGVVIAALGPVALLAIAFPEGGREPFAASAFWPIPILAAGLLAIVPRHERALRAGIALYAAGCALAFAVPTPVGGNAARLGVLVAGPLAALVCSPRRRGLLLACAPALLYLQWHAAIADVVSAGGSASTSPGYYRPLLSFLEREARGSPPFRLEVPFTADHWEAYEVAPRIPLARGWERQLDIADDGLFYDGRLTARAYRTWLDDLAVRYVALPDAALDPSGAGEARLIRHGLPYLRLVWRTRHWRVYAVDDPSALASGAATATAIGPDWVALDARGPGRATVRVRWSPYWRLSGSPGCVSRAGPFVAVSLRRAGPVRLVIAFSLSRIGASSPRCG